MTNRYRCNHCWRIVARESEKRWILSYCTHTQRMTRLWRLTEPTP